MSAIVAGLIPKIEGFQPIPNAVMIPFMEAQSAALAYGFGLNYEYGKRKIRSMSNDEFNSLTSEQITNMSNEHTHIILSQFQAQVPKVMPMQHEIFKQYVTIEKAKVQQNFELAKWMVQFIKQFVDDETAHLMGGHLHDTDFNKNKQTFFDPNNPEKDFAPPPGGPPAATKPVVPTGPTSRRTPTKTYTLTQVSNPTTGATVTYQRTEAQLIKNIQALRNIQKTFVKGGVNFSAPNSAKIMVTRNIQLLKGVLFKITGKVF